MQKADIIEVLEQIAVLLELQGENPFKIRAYQAGARGLETLEDDLGARIAAGTLGELPGFGEALVEKIETLHRTGKLDYYEKLKAAVPAGLLEMLEVPGLGGKKIRRLHEDLGLTTLAELEAACRDGRVAELKGFGAKTAENILKGIANRAAYQARHLWWQADTAATAMVEGLRRVPGVERAEAAGSLRRHRETVGDLDFIVAAREPGPVMDWFTGQEGIQEVTARGETKSSIRLLDGMQADLRVVPPEQFAFALHHFTGSKEHNVLMRQRALKRGLSLSEWGLFADTGEAPAEVAGGGGRPSVAGIATEEDLFRALGLRWIPPELREAAGEIEAAEGEGFPRLVEAEDILGVFHNHTTASDGRASLEVMTAAAEVLGFEYLGIADHSKSSFQANGLDEGRLLAQVEQIRRLNASGRFSCHVFAGSEVDILGDGELDFDDGVLAQLDYVVASVHSRFNLDEEAMTRRIIRALENPHVTMLGHMTGRLLLRREAYPVNAAKVIDAAAANGKIIELNANPARLDMDWRHWRRAAEKGVLCSINPDAHEPEGLILFHAGVAVARKGWLRREDIFNCRPLAEVQAWLASRKQGESGR